MSYFEKYAPLIYAGLVVLVALVVEPYCRRKGRHPFKSKLTDFYRAVPMVLSACAALIYCFLDILRRLVDEQNREVRSYLTTKCVLSVLLFIGMASAIQPLLRFQRWMDPSGEGRGWQCIAFMLISNAIAVVLLVTATLFIKFI